MGGATICAVPTPRDLDTQRNIDTDISIDFKGVGVSYFCRRNKATFTVRHVMAQVAKGRFVDGQVGTFERYWDEFLRFIT
jgi:hypothetical protein